MADALGKTFRVDSGNPSESGGRFCGGHIGNRWSFHFEKIGNDSPFTLRIAICYRELFAEATDNCGLFLPMTTKQQKIKEKYKIANPPD